MGVGSEFLTFFPISIILQLFCNITFIRNVYISNFSPFRSRGVGVIENQIFPKFKIVHIILGGGGGQENYGLFPQFGTFHVWKAPLMPNYRYFSSFCRICLPLFLAKFLTESIGSHEVECFIPPWPKQLS